MPKLFTLTYSFNIQRMKLEQVQRNISENIDHSKKLKKDSALILKICIFFR